MQLFIVMIRFVQKVEVFSRPLLKKLLPQEIFEQVTFFMRLGYWPNLKVPRSVNEKISHQKISALPTGIDNLVDKLEVRNFVESRIGDKYLTHILAIYENPEEIKLSELPESFALKCNAGSGTNRVIKEKATVSRAALVNICQQWISQPYSALSSSYENIYDSIKPKIFVEKLLTPLETLQEYKIWCFNGQPHYIQVSAEVSGRERFKFYDLDWNDCEFRVYHEGSCVNFHRPDCVNELVSLAQKLSSGFPFVRVDLHVSEDSGITFSELTFHPGGGRIRFFPREFDFKLGELFPI